MTTEDEILEHRLRIEGLAREHLSADDADQYLNLLRPAVRMEHAETAVGRSHLGGSPILDDSTSWPHWDGTPLSF